MTLKTTPRLLPQEPSVNPSGASLPNPGLGAEALEIKKTTDQFAQKEANLAPATPRPSLVGRTALLSSSEPEEFLLLTPPSRREKSQNQPLAASPNSNESTPPSAAGKVEKKAPQNKFFGPASSDSSAENSPLKTPEASAAPCNGTPSALAAAKAIIRGSDADATLVRSDRELLAKGLKCLNDLASPEHSNQVESVRRLVVDKLGQTSPVLAIRSNKPAAQRNLTLAFAACPALTDTWIPLILGPINTFVIDRDHLTEFKGSGMHICPPGHPLEARIIDRKIHRATNIWCGQITTPEKENKFSSFIPRMMTENEYYSLLNEAFANKEQCIARGGNKALFMLPHEKNSFCIEAYFRENQIVTSAFPIFHYEKYDGKMKTLKIEIENSNPPTLQVYEVSYEDILQKVKALKKGDDLPIEYDTATDLIIDLTLLLDKDPKFPVCPISRGILVHIPKNLI